MLVGRVGLIERLKLCCDRCGDSAGLSLGKQIADEAGVRLPLIAEDEVLAAVELAAEVLGESDAGVIACEGFVLVDGDDCGEADGAGGIEGGNG